MGRGSRSPYGCSFYALPLCFMFDGSSNSQRIEMVEKGVTCTIFPLLVAYDYSAQV